MNFSKAKKTKTNKYKSRKMSLYLFAIPKRKQNVLWKRHDKEKFFQI